MTRDATRGTGLGPARIALIYALFGTLWILFSDWIAMRWLPASFSEPAVQSFKGLFYVGITALLVYGLVRASIRRVTAERTRYRNLFEHDEHQLKALLALTRATLFQSAHPGAPLRKLTSIVARAMGAQRVSVWYFTPDREALQTRDLFELHEEQHSAGHAIAAADFPAYFRALTENEVIAADDACRDVRTREFREPYLKPLGITSMLDAPIHIDGKPEGVLCIEHVGTPRQWTHGEQAFAIAASNLVSMMSAQGALAESRRQLTSLMDHLPGAVYRCLFDTEWTTLFMSEGITALAGYEAADFLHNARLTYAQVIHPEDRERVYLQVKAAVERGESFEIEYRIRARDGAEKTVWERGRFFPAAHAYGNQASEGYLEGFILDITEYRRAEAERHRIEERLRQTQKLEAIGQLAGGVAHDFNNMLTVILVQAEMALRKVKAAEPLYGNLLEIHDAAEHSAGLTRQLLTYARRQSVQPQIVDLNQLVEAAVPMLRGIVGSGIQVLWMPTARSARPEHRWTVEIDPSQVDQILVNLCLNARDAIQERPRGEGTIALETRNVALRAEDCRARPELSPGDYVLLNVTDNGAGMDAATLTRLFEPFFTTKEIGKGTGLGLPTVHGIVRQNLGTVEVDSEPGKGSVFHVYLPRRMEGHVMERDETSPEILNALPPAEMALKMRAALAQLPEL